MDGDILTYLHALFEKNRVNLIEGERVEILAAIAQCSMDTFVCYLECLSLFLKYVYTYILYNIIYTLRTWGTRQSGPLINK